MKQVWGNFIFLLNKSADLYAELLELAKTKKEILVSGQPERLPEITKQEELLIMQVNKFEEARVQLVAELALHYGKKTEEMNLAELKKTSALEGMQDDFAQAGERLRIVIDQLSKLNQLNARLTQQALFFVNCNINLLLQNAADSTYAPTNNSLNQAGSAVRSRLLIDRKV